MKQKLKKTYLKPSFIIFCNAGKDVIMSSAMPLEGDYLTQPDKSWWRVQN